ncbi:N-acetylglucosamine kinase [Curtobacterium sp. VKM Ac-1376]|uniref:N-acetylglucosamine kinase n=1 Tax=Curtobacterium sp. VKM Ac-1376 TaxID=123312 RepID=UPI00188AC9AE|nr:BadF/BadG/BcrA/BcrD ATPase family protein [Curtobacterium sp. VKM Ac-1376]MBF4616225.1 ATPase [Curtobacterium sp. VKM Ac-1376]
MIDMLLDVGQTSARARLVLSGEVVGEVDDLPGFVSGSDICQAIEASIATAADELGAPKIDRVAAGCSGLFGAVPDITRLGQALNAGHATRVLRLADDGVSAFLGALDGAPGAMVAAGTGIVALAFGPAGATRADGVGAMLGDNGSGWWIGRAGIVAALSAADGRAGGSPRLLDAAVRRYGPVEVMPTVIASSGTPIATTAAFAIDVADAARTGDPVARQIWHDAAGYIGDAIVAVASRAELGDDLRWCTAGRVALSRDLLEPVLSERILAKFPNAQWTAPVATPFEGLAHLLHLDTLTDFGHMAAEYRHE